MSDIDKLDMLPVGIRYSFWIVAIGKFILETGHLSADENLSMLKSIHSIPDELWIFRQGSAGDGPAGLAGRVRHIRRGHEAWARTKFSKC